MFVKKIKSKATALSFKNVLFFRIACYFIARKF